MIANGRVALICGDEATLWLHLAFHDAPSPKIVSLYARGMTVREIQSRTGDKSHLEEMYGTEVSPTLILSVTEAVMDEVKAWQARPLDSLYPMIVYLDCIHAKVRDTSAVRVKAGYLALGVNLNGDKDPLARHPPGQADVPGRGPLWPDQRCAPLLGAQTGAPAVPGHVNPRVHLCLRRGGRGQRQVGFPDPAARQH